MTRKTIALFFVVFFLLFGPKPLFAQEKNDCTNRFLTLINPVRGRSLWIDSSLKPLENQFNLIKDHDFSATWLLQYDALVDDEIVDYIKNNFSEKQELGLFLEVSPDFAQSSRVIYPHMVAWFDPQAVFLSGYTQNEREKLIDTLFDKFKETFGKYPTSVGAWWIDSYSLNYMKKNYDIKTALIVADQKTTDDYGIWGQWWGIPYYPSKSNILTPAQNEKDKQNLVILQWAQRDLTKAHGQDKTYSNYSLQANDYTERGLDTSYFNSLTQTYLDCSLPIGQITVGLETGIESVKSFPEYKNQLRFLADTKNLQSVTMDKFSDHFQNFYVSNPQKIVLKDSESEWALTLQKRENIYLKEEIIYQKDLAFSDYFLADKSDFLDRKLPIDRPSKNHPLLPLFIPLAFVLGFLTYRRSNLASHYWYLSLFILTSFLTTFMDYSKFGWNIYFGPILENIPLAQFSLILISFLLFIPVLKFFEKKIKDTKLLTLTFSLSFALDFLLSRLRYIQLDSQYYFGFAWDTIKFIGLKISPGSLSLVNQDFDSIISASFLRFDFDLIWQNKLMAFVIYPLIHIALGTLTYLLCKKLPKKLRQFILLVMFIFFCLYICQTLNLDPRIVL